MSLQEQLRQAVENIRRKSFPISDLIPLLQKAADRIDRLELEAGPVMAYAPARAINTQLATQGQRLCADVFNKH